MKIKGYEHANDIPDEEFDSFINAQITCWGMQPFGEFAVCKNTDCGKLYSIEDIFGENKDMSPHYPTELNFCCEICNSPTRYMYPKEDFSDLFREYFQREVGAILMFDESDATKVEGFGVMSKTTITELVDMEFATRPGSFDKQELAKNIAKRAYGNESLQDETIVCFHQLYISKKIRNAELFWNALESLFSLHNYSGTPIALETRFDSRVYPLMRLLGFEDLDSDSYGYTVQLAQDYGDISDYVGNNPLKQQQKSIALMKKYLQEAKQILDENPGFSQKFYISS